MKLTGASFRRGKSKQDYQTPADFRAAIVNKFGMPALDLAADSENHFGRKWFSLQDGDDSFKQDWHRFPGLLWLNPPFDRIEPWAEKCHSEALQGARILLLIPASVGAVWYGKHVHGTATAVYFLCPRLCFDGKAPYPKDCLLARFGSLDETQPFPSTAYLWWRWK